jgi:hypothetical protein
MRSDLQNNHSKGTESIAQTLEQLPSKKEREREREFGKKKDKSQIIMYK